MAMNIILRSKTSDWTIMYSELNKLMPVEVEKPVRVFYHDW